jgi:chaperonin GroES
MTKKLSLKPLGDRVVVRPLNASGEKKLASGIIIPETVNKEKLYEGEVVTVGTGRRDEKGNRIPLEVKVGDKVFFKKPWDEPIKLDGEEFYVLSESDILLIEN